MNCIFTPISGCREGKKKPKCPSTHRLRGSDDYMVPTWNPSILRCSDSQSSYRQSEGFHFFCKASNIRFSSSRSTSLLPMSPRAWRTNMLLKRVLKGSAAPAPFCEFVISCGAAVCGDDSREESSFASHCDGALSDMAPDNRRNGLYTAPWYRCAHLILFPKHSCHQPCYY